MDLNSFLASENGPPWLPASVAESRKLLYVGQLLALVFAIIAILVGVIRVITGSIYDGATSLVIGALGLLVVYMLKEKVFVNLDQGRFKQADDELLIWMIIGFIVYIIPGIVLLLGYLKLQEAIQQPQYQQYQAQQYQVVQDKPAGPAPAAPAPAAPAPQQPSAPVQPSQPAQPAASEQHADKKVEMVKCRKCGVNFPIFMHTCPNCNEPKH